VNEQEEQDNDYTISSEDTSIDRDYRGATIMIFFWHGGFEPTF
jgi:hypothetical protein